jgi:DNA repair protein RecO (recombination protein O)
MNLTEGIVVKTINYQDNAKIVYLITANGKKSIIVKGATNLKSHTFSYAQELTKLGYDIKDKYLSAGKIINSYSNIKSSYDKIHSALLIIEIAYDLIDHINDFDTFYTFLDNVLSLIDGQDYYQILELIFRVKTLYLLGVSPIFTRCIECESKENLVGFSFYNGGMKCTNCVTHDDLIYKDEVILSLKQLYLIKLEDLEKNLDKIVINYDELNLFLNRYYEHYLGFVSRVSRIFTKMEK